MKSITQFIISIIIGIIILIDFGCNTVENNESKKIQILTNNNTYNIDSSATIKLLITNNSQNSIYYICSGDIYLEELNDGMVIEEWKVNGFEECLAIRSIEPKERKEYNFTYASEFSVFKLQNATYTQSVQYRFRIDFYFDENLESELTADAKYSNEIYLLK